MRQGEIPRWKVQTKIENTREPEEKVSMEMSVRVLIRGTGRVQREPRVQNWVAESELS